MTVFFVDVNDPGVYNVADDNDFVRVVNVFVRQFADVNQPAVPHAKVNKRPKIDDVQNGAFEFHARFQVFQFKNLLFENRSGHFVSRVFARLSQLSNNLFDGGFAQPQFL